MALRSKEFSFGDMYGFIHDFEEVGDELPVHIHNKENNHISIVARGTIRCIGRAAIEGKLLRAGDVVDWVENEAHGFVAEEDNTRLINVVKYAGKP